jgi:hypothetical protein
MKPSRGEKPPLMISSRSQSWRSLRTMAGSFSDSARSSSRRGASRAMRSLRIPPEIRVSAFLSCKKEKRVSASARAYRGEGWPCCLCDVLRLKKGKSKEEVSQVVIWEMERAKGRERSWTRTNTKMKHFIVERGDGGPYVARASVEHGYG